MYNIDMKSNFDILSFENLYWGIKNDIISPYTAIEYANEYLNRYPNCEDSKFIELLILDNYHKENVLKIINADKGNGEKEKRSIRYMVLKHINEKETDTQKLVEQIDNVYVDFDYPNDMVSFIYYMPINNEDILRYNPSQRLKKLKDKFEIFLEQEYNWIKGQN